RGGVGGGGSRGGSPLHLPLLPLHPLLKKACLNRQFSAGRAVLRVVLHHLFKNRRFEHPVCCYNSHYDYYISVGLKAWTATEGYWGVYSELLKALQKRILELDIELAIPQQDIRVHPSELPEIATKEGAFEDK
ncbi:MAG: hypothetical protein AB4060_03200, partial [Crocosphaera sp.]